MSEAAQVALRMLLHVVDYVLDRQSPQDRCAMCRHLQRTFGERAAMLEAQEFHRKERESAE